jgi:HEPN domain-containing protein
MKKWIYFLNKAKKTIVTASHALQTQDYRASMYHSQEALENLARAILVLHTKEVTNLTLELEKLNQVDNILLKSLTQARDKYGRIGFPEFSLNQPLFNHETCSKMLIEAQSSLSWILKIIASITGLDWLTLYNL